MEEKNGYLYPGLRPKPKYSLYCTQYSNDYKHFKSKVGLTFPFFLSISDMAPAPERTQYIQHVPQEIHLTSFQQLSVKV